MKREKQMTFANTGFERYSRQTKRAVFLDEMNAIVPWKRLCALIAPHYPTGEGGRPPIPLKRMLRIYFLQQWFNLSDPGVEEALYDMTSMRAFAGIDLGDAPVPDETTVCKFRHLLEENNLGPAILRDVNQFLASRKVNEAPSSTKNSSGERDPEMHQTKKGNEWHFGMKAHIGVDSKSRLVHSVVATSANVHDSRVLPDLLHSAETRVWGQIESHEIARSFSRRACLPRSQAHLWFCKSTLSWTCEKRASLGRQLRAFEYLLESKTLAAGVVRPKVDQTTR